MSTQTCRLIGSALLACVVVAIPSVSTAQGWLVPRSFVDLPYPADALAARVQGTVVVRLSTDASGKVDEAEALSGPPLLRQAAVANALQWTLPQIGVRTHIQIYRFAIEHGLCNDDGRSLFRLAQANLAVITACSSPGRRQVPYARDALPLESWGPPVYPQIARSARVTGVLALELSIDSKGRVTNVVALNDIPLLTKAAVDHAKTWQVRMPAPRRGIVIYEFTLDDIDCSSEMNVVFSRVDADYRRLNACSPTIDAETSARR